VLKDAHVCAMSAASTSRRERTTEESQRVLKRALLSAPDDAGLIPLAFGNTVIETDDRYRPKAVIRRLALGQRRRKAALSGFSSTLSSTRRRTPPRVSAPGGTYTERPHDGSPRAA